MAKTKNLRMMNKIIFGVEKIDKCSGTAYALGYGGAVPFIVFVAMQWHGYQLIQDGVSLTYFYGSIILSFLGAPHWGYILAIADKAKIKNLAGRLVIGVIPSLIAFFSILFDEFDRLLIIGSSFIFAGARSGPSIARRLTSHFDSVGERRPAGFRRHQAAGSRTPARADR